MLITQNHGFRQLLKLKKDGVKVDKMQNPQLLEEPLIKLMVKEWKMLRTLTKRG